MKYGRVAQVVEHLTFNQVVRGSNPRTLSSSEQRKPVKSGFFFYSFENMLMYVIECKLSIQIGV